MFGDILKVVDENCDIWGNCNIISNINNNANINQIRYRGYYYDNETNLYYLNSRYYDSFTHRFISIDSIEYMDFDTLGGLNLWTYCNNNPIMYVDPDGYFCILTAMLIGTVVGLIAGGAASLTANFTLGSTIGGFAGSIICSAMYKVYDIYKINQIAKQGVVVIGEGMNRVHDYANKIGAGTFKASKLANFTFEKINKKLCSLLTYSNNVTWIRRVIKSGVNIANIGIIATRNERSVFYIMEILNIIKGVLY